MKEIAKSNYAVQQRDVDISSKRTYHFTKGSITSRSSPSVFEKGISMTIKEKMHGKIAVLRLKGNLMGEPDTENLRDKIYSLLQEGFNKIVVDMKGVRWISSSGLGTLIAALTSVRNKSGDLRLANITEKVESLFAITQLVKVFKTYETVDRAVASFK
jgi:anti-sigma B factor antagonist